MALGKTDLDFDKFKTPYIRIRVGNASGKNLTELPQSIHRLVEKVEITETFEGCNITSQFNVTFKEGSMEPFKKAVTASAKGLYKDVDATNATGMLTDLRFVDLGQGSTGFSSLIPSAVGSALASAVPSLNSIPQVSGVLGAASPSPENKIIVSDDTAPQKVTYVFQEKNTVEITWGYLEDQVNYRTIRGNIIVVESDFPEMGHPTTTINCAGPGAWLDQLTPTKAIYFKEDSIVGLDAGGPLITFADKDIEATLKQLFPGFDLLVSPNLLNKKLDKNHVKMLAAGKSPEQFLRKLRKSTNAIYISYYSPKTGKPTIAFLSRNDFMAKELFPTRALFTYKAPGSILKNIKIRADFNGLSGSSMSGVASDGTTVEAISTNGGAAETLFEGKSILDSSPANGNIIPEAANMNSGILGNDKLTVGNVEVSPEADEPASLIDEAQSKAACMNRLIFIEFGSLGYTRLSNGMVYFGGIGNRYSGQYEVKTVTHLIDNNGYNCRGVAQTSMIDGLSGVKPSAASVGQPSTEEVQLFDPKVSFNTLNPSDIGSSLASASVGANKMDEYLEDIFS